MGRHSSATFVATNGFKKFRSLASNLVAIATVLLVVIMSAGIAHADAAKAVPSETKATANGNPDGSVTVKISGKWTWSSVRCQNRYGVSWAIDWSGISTSANPLPSWKIRSLSGFYFHVGNSMDGVYPFTSPCKGTSGTWSATKIYSSSSQVPSKLCVSFYDVHGNSTGPSSPSELDPAVNDDNSANQGDFSVANNCATPASNFLTASETHNPQSPTAGNNVSESITVTNLSSSVGASNVTLTTQISSGEITSVSGTGWSCSPTSATTASCTIAAIGPGASAPPISHVVHTAFSSTPYTLTNTSNVTNGNSAPNSNTFSIAVGASGTDFATGFIPKDGGYVTTCGSVATFEGRTIPGPTDNTCTATFFPAADQGGVATLIQSLAQLTICATDGGCNGKSVDVRDPGGYTQLTGPIEIVMRITASVATGSEFDSTRKVFVQKTVAGGDIQAFAIPLCTSPIPGLPCLREFLRVDGDLLAFIEMFSGDPIFDIGNGLGD